jgi:hypothetical protein
MGVFLVSSVAVAVAVGRGMAQLGAALWMAVALGLLVALAAALLLDQLVHPSR